MRLPGKKLVSVVYERNEYVCRLHRDRSRSRSRLMMSSSSEAEHSEPKGEHNPQFGYMVENFNQGRSISSADRESQRVATETDNKGQNVVANGMYTKTDSTVAKQVEEYRTSRRSSKSSVCESQVERGPRAISTYGQSTNINTNTWKETPPLLVQRIEPQPATAKPSLNLDSLNNFVRDFEDALRNYRDRRRADPAFNGRNSGTISDDCLGTGGQERRWVETDKLLSHGSDFVQGSHLRGQIHNVVSGLPNKQDPEFECGHNGNVDFKTTVPVAFNNIKHTIIPGNLDRDRPIAHSSPKRSHSLSRLSSLGYPFHADISAISKESSDAGLRLLPGITGHHSGNRNETAGFAGSLEGYNGRERIYSQDQAQAAPTRGIYRRHSSIQSGKAANIIKRIGTVPSTLVGQQNRNSIRQTYSDGIGRQRLLNESHDLHTPFRGAQCGSGNEVFYRVRSPFAQNDNVSDTVDPHNSIHGESQLRFPMRQQCHYGPLYFRAGGGATNGWEKPLETEHRRSRSFRRSARESSTGDVAVSAEHTRVGSEVDLRAYITSQDPPLFSCPNNGYFPENTFVERDMQATISRRNGNRVVGAECIVTSSSATIDHHAGFPIYARQGQVQLPKSLDRLYERKLQIDDAETKLSRQPRAGLSSMVRHRYLHDPMTEPALSCREATYQSAENEMKGTVTYGVPGLPEQHFSSHSCNKYTQADLHPTHTTAGRASNFTTSRTKDGQVLNPKEAEEEEHHRNNRMSCKTFTVSDEEYSGGSTLVNTTTSITSTNLSGSGNESKALEDRCSDELDGEPHAANRIMSIRQQAYYCNFVSSADDVRFREPEVHLSPKTFMSEESLRHTAGHRQERCLQLDSSAMHKKSDRGRAASQGAQDCDVPLLMRSDRCVGTDLEWKAIIEEKRQQLLRELSPQDRPKFSRGTGTGMISFSNIGTNTDPHDRVAKGMAITPDIKGHKTERESPPPPCPIPSAARTVDACVGTTTPLALTIGVSTEDLDIVAEN